MTNQSSGSDGLPAQLLKCASDCLAGPLTHLFCMSIYENRFPEYWKLADVIPIPKERKCTLDNLRPISLTPIVAKMLEKIVLNNNIHHFVNNFGEHQCAYR